MCAFFTNQFIHASQVTFLTKKFASHNENSVKIQTNIVNVFKRKHAIDRGGQVHGRTDSFHPVNATRATPATQRTQTAENQQFIRTHFELHSNSTVIACHDLNRDRN